MDVVVIDRARPGAGASYGNAGWITPALAAPLPDPAVPRVVVSSVLHGDSPLYLRPSQALRLAPWLLRFLRHCTPRAHAAGLAATSALAANAMNLYDDLAADGVAFDMAPTGLTFLARSADKAEAARRSLEPVRAFGWSVPESTSAAGELVETDPGIGAAVGGGFTLRAERRVHPMSLLDGLSARLSEMGVSSRLGAPVVGFERIGGAVSAVRVAGDRVPASAVVLAAGVWTRELARDLGVRIPLVAGNGYSAVVTPRVVPRRPYYLIEAKAGVTPYGDRMRIAGTMELTRRSTRFDQRRLDALLRTAQPYVSGWKPEIDDPWMGPRPMTPDGLPVIGRAPGWSNVVVATGHAMLGVTLAPSTGRLVADLVAGGDASPLLRPFRVERFRQRSGT